MSLISPLVPTVSVGDLQLIYTGVVHISGDKPITVRVSSLTFRISFKFDEGEPRYVGLANEDSLELHLYNHKNPLGEGVYTPIRLAILSGRPLYLTYYVQTINTEKADRRIELSILLGVAE